jgi:hypothetical protein
MIVAIILHFAPLETDRWADQHGNIHAIGMTHDFRIEVGAAVPIPRVGDTIEGTRQTDHHPLPWQCSDGSWEAVVKKVRWHLFHEPSDFEDPHSPEHMRDMLVKLDVEAVPWTGEVRPTPKVTP